MKTDEYEAYVQTKINTPLECSYLGLAGEVGELLDRVKKVSYHGHEQDRNKELLELGDILFYVTDIATRRLNATLAAIMAMNVTKLNERYKAAFTVTESINRKPDAK